MAYNDTYIAKLDENRNPILDENGDKIMELVESIYVEDEPITSEIELANDKLFGIKLLDTFLTDNRDLAVAFTPEISLGLLQKFAPIKALAEVGDIKTTKAMLMLTTIDPIFTQERKDKYIQMCNDHLGI